MSNKQNKYNNELSSNDMVINNLKKQLRIKTDRYNELMYMMAIKTVADDIFKIDEKNHIVVSSLPYMIETYNNN